MNGSGKGEGKEVRREVVVNWRGGREVKKKKLKWKDNIYCKERGNVLLKKKDWG
jgi:hypothetical protein